tara:strand:- start:1950 stop:3005 length:1056 start_codon:yes stop_codon:yes gene_type:complete
MIDRKFRWEEEWRIKSRMEPWICYIGGAGGAGGDPRDRFPVTDPRHPDYVAPPTTPTPPTATTPTPPTASPTESPTASPTESPTASPTDGSDANPPPEYTPPPPEAAVDKVGQAQDAVSGMPKLGDPSKIPAPSQRTVNVQELVEYRISKMLEDDNPYLQASVTRAKQLANQSGMLNTSIAASAGVDAAIKSVLPIAQQDAATLHGQALENQRAVNEFLMQDYMTRNQFKLTEFGYKNTTYNNALQQAHEQNENSIQRNWQTNQNTLDRELTIWRDKFDAALQKILASMGFEHDVESGNTDCVRAATAAYTATAQQILAAYTTGQISVATRNSLITDARNLMNDTISKCAG